MKDLRFPSSSRNVYFLPRKGCLVPTRGSAHIRPAIRCSAVSMGDNWAGQRDAHNEVITAMPTVRSGLLVLGVQTRARVSRYSTSQWFQQNIFPSNCLVNIARPTLAILWGRYIVSHLIAFAAEWGTWRQMSRVNNHTADDIFEQQPRVSTLNN